MCAFKPIDVSCCYYFYLCPPSLFSSLSLSLSSTECISHPPRLLCQMFHAIFFFAFVPLSHYLVPQTNFSLVFLSFFLFFGAVCVWNDEENIQKLPDKRREVSILCRFTIHNFLDSGIVTTCGRLQRLYRRRYIKTTRFHLTRWNIYCLFYHFLKGGLR
jgi:hypothetical protein